MNISLTFEAELIRKKIDLLGEQVMNKRKKSKLHIKQKKNKLRIKRGVNFHDEMKKGKYGWNEAAHLGWF